MKRQNGFTIIEVTLVLALAGLIFAMTFVALPNLLASQRDAQRREDMMSFVTDLKNFQTNNNRGALPGATSSDALRGQSDQLYLEGGRAVTVNGAAVASDRQAKTQFNATSWAGFYRDFFDDNFADPNGSYYNLYVAMCTKTNINYGQPCNNGDLAGISSLPAEVNNTIYIAVEATCEGDTAVRSANPRKVAVVYKLEHSGQYCYSD